MLEPSRSRGLKSDCDQENTELEDASKPGGSPPTAGRTGPPGEAGDCCRRKDSGEGTLVEASKFRDGTRRGSESMAARPGAMFSAARETAGPSEARSVPRAETARGGGGAQRCAVETTARTLPLENPSSPRRSRGVIVQKKKGMSRWKRTRKVLLEQVQHFQNCFHFSGALRNLGCIIDVGERY